MPRKGKYLPFPDVSLSDLLWEKCLVRGDEVSIIDNAHDENSLTFREVYEFSKNCAAFLHKESVKVGDFIAVCAPSCSEYVIAMLGILGSGAAITHCNPAFEEGEILQQFTVSNPKIAIVHETAIETMKKVKEKIKSLEAIIVIGKSEEFITFETVCKKPGDMSFLRDLNINPSEDIAVLPYSSGTTGLPKSVMLTHRNMITIIYSMVEALRWGEKDVLYMDRPMYHAGGFLSVFVCLSVGMKLIMEKEFVAEKMLKIIEKYKVTCAMMVPPIMIDLANLDNTERYDTSSLTSVVAGGAVMAPHIRRRLDEKFNFVLIPIYGLTEYSPVTMGYDRMKNDFSSVGRVCANVEVKVIDLETSHECIDGKDGEILVRGPQAMKGYLKNPEANAKTFHGDGWMHTGDIGHFDEDGLLYIVDRLKEVIKYKSLQVPPAELEAVLLKHPKIADVGVIGIPDPHDGELPKAFVVKKDKNLTEQEVDEFVKSQLVDYKHLRGGVEFVAGIPKSLAGKIDRKELKKMAGICN